MKKSTIFKALIFGVMTFTLLVSNGLTATLTPTPAAGWVPYVPTVSQVTLKFTAPSTMTVDISCPTTGYRVADPGGLAKAMGINPDGTTYYSYLTSHTKLESYNGPVLTVLTTLRITYQVPQGDTTYFGFQVYINGNDQFLKATQWKRIGGGTPTPIRLTPIPPTVTPTPMPPTVTPTPTPRPATPTPTIEGYRVGYFIQSDWKTGATINVTITNKTTTPVNGWTLAWTFPGNQKITNLWNGVYTQSGASVSVKNAVSNGNIPAGGGSVNFGFNLSYSGINAIPSSFKLNGIACQIF